MENKNVKAKVNENVENVEQASKKSEDIKASDIALSKDRVDDADSVDEFDDLDEIEEDDIDPDDKSDCYIKKQYEINDRDAFKDADKQYRIHLKNRNTVKKSKIKRNGAHTCVGTYPLSRQTCRF